MAVPEDEAEELSWHQLLSFYNPIFNEMRASKCIEKGKINIMCEIRGDLFVWCNSRKVMLTTHLKRIVAKPKNEQVFQELQCTRQPEMDVVRCLPSPSDKHIALQCEGGLSVMSVHDRLRGEHGEFKGGTKNVLTTVDPVASDYFTIHQDANHPTLLQVCWHPTAHFQLALLTIDSVIRFYSLADPNIVILTLSLPSCPTPGVLHSMKSPVVSFALWKDSAFILQDGAVTLTKLTHVTPPPPPLLMHPETDDDFNSEAASILVLPSTPCVVVIASTNGTLSHCIYLDNGDEIETDEDKAASSQQSLYVVESISFDIGDTSPSTVFPFSLIADPIELHTYYVVHADGVHRVTLPWLLDFQKFSDDDCTGDEQPLVPLANEKQACIELIIQTEFKVNRLVGVALVSELMLGHTLIGLNSDWECQAVPLYGHHGHHVGLMLDSLEQVVPLTPTMRHVDAPPDGFTRTIENVLKPGKGQVHETSPLLRSFSGKKDFTQAECFRFLSGAIHELKKRHFLSQKEANEQIKRRIKMLVERKQIIFSERVSIEDELETLESENESLLDKLDSVKKRHAALENKTTRLACLLESQSPMLSQAEECMGYEIEGLTSHMQVMHKRLSEVGRKWEIYCGPGHTPKVDVNLKQSTTILGTLTDSGHSIKSLMVQLQSLKEATQGL